MLKEHLKSLRKGVIFWKHKIKKNLSKRKSPYPKHHHHHRLRYSNFKNNLAITARSLVSMKKNQDNMENNSNKKTKKKKY